MSYKIKKELNVYNLAIQAIRSELMCQRTLWEVVIQESQMEIKTIHNYGW